MLADSSSLGRTFEVDYTAGLARPRPAGPDSDAIPAGSPDKIRVLLAITRLAFGGATNVALDIAAHFQNHPRVEAHLAAGPVEPGEVDLTNVAHEHGVPTWLVPHLSNRLSPRLAVRAVSELTALMRHGRYDIVHTHSSVAGVLGRTAAVLAGVPVIVHHVHGWGLQDGMSASMRLVYLSLERFCAIFTDRLIAVSKPTIQTGLHHWIAGRHKFALIYNGIAVEAFREPVDDLAIRRALGLDPTCPLVGMIGRLDRQKNPLDFIRVAALVAAEHPSVQFVMLGDGVLRPDCEALIDALDLRKRVFLLGFRNDVHRIMPVLTLVVSTSLWEGLPLVFQEAMSAGKPIVANDVDGVGDVVVDGETGYLVAPHNPQRMAERLLHLLKDEAVRSRMAVAASRDAVMFGREPMFSRLEALYADLASAHVWSPPKGEPGWVTT